MKLRKPSSRCLRGRHDAGRAILPVLVVLAAGALGWIWWQSARPVTKGSARLAPSLRPVVKSNGTWIIPLADRDGKPREPMVLVPVASRLDEPAPPSVTRTSALPVLPPAPLPPPVVVTALSNPVARPHTNQASSLPPAKKAVLPGNTNRFHKAFDERLLAAQLALAQLGFSSGPLDGVPGPQTRAAFAAFQSREGLLPSGTLNAATLARLNLDAPLFGDHVVSAEDLAGLQAVGATWLAKSQQGALAHESLLERLAERTRTNPKLLRWLNPGVEWERVAAGTSVRLLQVGEPVPAAKAAFLRIFLADRKLQAYDAETNLIAHFPCSIAARVDKRPLGEELRITVVAPNPNYTFDPSVFPESAEAREIGRKLILQPGPNNPVGTVWLGLDKPGYGIHGTPKPEDVGRTESHGCFRLANWNAEHLLKLVSVGTPVFVEP